MEYLIIDHIFSFIFIFASLLISLFSFKDILENRPFTSFLVVISSFGFIVSTCVSFNLNLGRYFIILYYIFCLGFFILKIIIDPGSLYKFLKEKKEFIQLFILAGLISVLYFVYNLKINFMYNGHDPYFYGIPFEIIDGDYFTRIKIWDNYPMIWSKYHFFQGSIASIFLFFTGVKNIFLFKLYQIVLSIMMFFIFEENFKVKKTKNIFYYSLLLSLPILSWLNSTNGIFPFIFLVLAAIFYFEKKIDFCLLFILFFASSLSRHVIPGLSIFVVLFILYFKNTLNSKAIFLFLFPILNILSMVFLGKNPIDFDINFYLKGKFLADFFYGGWTAFLFQNTLIYSVQDFFVLKNYNYNTLLFAISSMTFLNFLIKLDKKLRLFLIINIISSLFLIISIYFDDNPSYRFSNYNLLTLSLFLINSILTFFLPIFLVLFLKNKFYKNKIFIFLTGIFYLTSIFNIAIFGGGVGLPNYYLFNIFIIFYILLDNSFIFQPIKMNWFILILIIGIIYPSFDSTSHIYDMKKIKLKENIKSNKIEFYKSRYDTINPILNSNIYGKRIKSYSKSSNRFHISNDFIESRIE